MTPIPVPDIDKVEKAIADLNSIDYANVSIEIVHGIVKKLMNGYSIRTLLFQPGLLLFRGVKYSDKPKFYNDIIYPPKDKAKVSRVSNNGEQMFYASTSKKAVFYELDAQAGDKLIISTWRLNNALLFNNVGYTKTNLETMGALRESPIDQKLDNPINNLIADYLAKSFCQKINESNIYLYKLSVAIANIHLHDVENNKFAGLFYPTIKLNGNEENFAILKNVIDKGLLDLEKTEFIEVLEKNNELYKYKILDFSDEIKNGYLNWKNLKDTWTLYDNTEDIYFIEDNEIITAYNKDGDSILPD